MLLFHALIESLSSLLLVDAFNYWLGILAFGFLIFGLYIIFRGRG